MITAFVEEKDKDASGYVCLENAYIEFHLERTEDALKHLCEYNHDNPSLKNIYHIIKCKHNGLEAKLINLTQVLKHDALKESLKNVHDLKSVLIIPNNDHMLLIFRANYFCGDEIIAYVKDPCKEEVYGTDYETILTNLHNAETKKYLEIKKKK